MFVVVFGLNQECWPLASFNPGEGSHPRGELGDLFGIDAAVGFIAGDDQNAIRAAAVRAAGGELAAPLTLRLRSAGASARRPP
jgi:hypothetical protein